MSTQIQSKPKTPAISVTPEPSDVTQSPYAVSFAASLARSALFTCGIPSLRSLIPCHSATGFKTATVRPDQVAEPPWRPKPLRRRLQPSVASDGDHRQFDVRRPLSVVEQALMGRD